MFVCSITFAQGVVIKSLKVHTNDNTSSVPVLSSAREQLVINFDVQSEYPPNINIIFKFRGPATGAGTPKGEYYNYY